MLTGAKVVSGEVNRESRALEAEVECQHSVPEAAVTALEQLLQTHYALRQIRLHILAELRHIHTVGKNAHHLRRIELQRQTAEHGLCVAHTACTHEQHVERLLICQRHKLGKLLHGAKYDGKLSHGKSS